MAGVVAPLAGLGGEHTAVPMAAIVAALTVVSVAALAVLARPALARREISLSTVPALGGADLDRSAQRRCRHPLLPRRRRRGTSHLSGTGKGRLRLPVRD